MTVTRKGTESGLRATDMCELCNVKDKYNNYFSYRCTRCNGCYVCEHTAILIHDGWFWRCRDEVIRPVILEYKEFP